MIVHKIADALPAPARGRLSVRGSGSGVFVRADVG